jgi:hypothetical protein
MVFSQCGGEPDADRAVPLPKACRFSLNGFGARLVVFEKCRSDFSPRKATLDAQHEQVPIIIRYGRVEQMQ